MGLSDPQKAAVEAYVEGTWPQATSWSTLTWDVWWTELGHLDGSLVIRAVRSLSAREHPPNWRAVRDEAGRLVAGAPALQEVRREFELALSGVGRYGTPVWSHPVVAETMRALGGWQRFCSADDDHWTQRLIADNYQAVAGAYFALAGELGAAPTQATDLVQRSSGTRELEAAERQEP